MTTEKQTGINFQSLNTGIDRIFKRQKLCKKKINDGIGQIIHEIDSTITKLDTQIEQNQNGSPKNSTKMLEENLEEMGTSILKSKPLIQSQEAHKEFFAYQSKLGKDLDKNFNKSSNSSIFGYDLDHKAQKEGISEYLISEGYFSVDKLLREECNLSTREQSDIIMALRKEINDLLIGLENDDITGIISWAESHTEELQKIDSDLLFQAYRYYFQRLVKQGKIEEAINLSREKLAADNNYQNCEEISKLMTSIVYMDDLDNSPYSELYDNEMTTFELKKILERDSKRIVGLPAENPLQTVFRAGVLTQPQFMKVKDIINKKDENGKGNDMEIPYAAELDKSFNYHSMIVCPISKEVCSPDNSAMMLKCGHIVSEQSIKKMLISRNKKKFKCPTCPNEQSISQVRKIIY